MIQNNIKLDNNWRRFEKLYQALTNIYETKASLDQVYYDFEKPMDDAGITNIYLLAHDKERRDSELARVANSMIVDYVTCDPKEDEEKEEGS